MKQENSYFDSIITGLEESLEYSKGNLSTAKKRKVTVSPIPTYDANRIKEIRKSLNYTQMIFAGALGVSVKTVEAWESGRNHPQGAASRFIQLLEMDHTILEDHGILSI